MKFKLALFAMWDAGDSVQTDVADDPLEWADDQNFNPNNTLSSVTQDAKLELAAKYNDSLELKLFEDYNSSTSVQQILRTAHKHKTKFREQRKNYTILTHKPPIYVLSNTFPEL